MKSQYIKRQNLPDSPGIYMFCDAKKRPLYIGRATSLRDRARSYFSSDLIATRGPRIVDMVTKSVTLKHMVTDSVLEAIILESNLIKKYQPRYNVDAKDNKSATYIVITDESWPRVFTMRKRDLDEGQIPIPRVALRGLPSVNYMYKFGPYVHGGLIRESLKILRKIFPFKDKKALDSRHEYFYRSIGRSPVGDDLEANRKYVRTIKYLSRFLEGKKDIVVKDLEREMRSLARSRKFEEANEIKRKLFALKHINDIALIRSDEAESDSRRVNQHRHRIEAYDIAHLSGTNVVGAMVVSINGENTSSEYRMFKVKRDMNNDIASLMEILSRRMNHSEWAYPDLIVVDGGEAQLRMTKAVLAARRIDIPVVAVTKDDKHKAREIIGNQEWAIKYKKEIISLNAESHRFVLRYHRKLRMI